MKKIWIQSILLAGMVVGLNSCIIDLDDDDFGGCRRGQGGRVEVFFDLPDFDGINLRMSGRVFLSQGPQQEVLVRGYDNLIDHLNTRVRNGIWEIDLDGCTRNPDDFTFFITLPDIRHLEITGAGDIISETVLTTNDIDLRIQGSGDIDLALAVDDVFSRVSGSGDIFLEGQGDELFYEVSGSGELRAFDCAFNEVRIDVSGAGDSEVQVSDFLDVRISGSGDVFYRGTPDISSNISGSGSVIDAN